MNNEPKPKPKNEPGSQMALGLSLGTCLGVSLGAALDNIGLWLPIGIALGIGMGSFIDLVNCLDKKFDKPAVTTTTLRCRKCGSTKIWKRYTTQKRTMGCTLGWCPHCRTFRFFHIEKTE